jgi:hypothetical protein
MRHLDAQDAELVRQTRLLVALVVTLIPEARRVALLGADPLAPDAASGA